MFDPQHEPQQHPTPNFIRDASFQRLDVLADDPKHPLPAQEQRENLHGTVSSKCGIIFGFSKNGRGFRFMPGPLNVTDFSCGFCPVEIDYRNLKSKLHRKHNKFSSITFINFEEIMTLKPEDWDLRKRVIKFFVQTFENQLLFAPSDSTTQNMASPADPTHGFMLTCPDTGEMYGWTVCPLHLFDRRDMTVGQGVSVWLLIRSRVLEGYLEMRNSDQRGDVPPPRESHPQPEPSLATVLLQLALNGEQSNKLIMAVEEGCNKKINAMEEGCNKKINAMEERSDKIEERSNLQHGEMVGLRTDVNQVMGEVNQLGTRMNSVENYVKKNVQSQLNNLTRQMQHIEDVRFPALECKVHDQSLVANDHEIGQDDFLCTPGSIATNENTPPSDSKPAAKYNSPPKTPASAKKRTRSGDDDETKGAAGVHVATSASAVKPPPFTSTSATTPASKRFCPSTSSPYSKCVLGEDYSSAPIRTPAMTDSMPLFSSQGCHMGSGTRSPMTNRTPLFASQVFNMGLGIRSPMTASTPLFPSQGFNMGSGTQSPMTASTPLFASQGFNMGWGTQSPMTASTPLFASQGFNMGSGTEAARKENFRSPADKRAGPRRKYGH